MTDTDIADVAGIEPFHIETIEKIIEELHPEVPLQKEMAKKGFSREKSFRVIYQRRTATRKNMREVPEAIIFSQYIKIKT
jgi:signal recognition particle subunit SEC65